PPPSLPYSLSLHDALPILVPEFDRELRGFSRWLIATSHCYFPHFEGCCNEPLNPSVGNLRLSTGESCAGTLRHSAARTSSSGRPDRKSTRLNSSHVSISYA